MATRHTKKQRFVQRAFKKNPHCTQCGILMVLPSEENNKGYTPNLCTYEHARSRVNPKRGKNTNGQTINHILCLKCNNENAHRDELIFLGEQGIKKAAQNGHRKNYNMEYG